MDIKSKNEGRFCAIDGMRGIAALGVVFHHLYGNLKLELQQFLPVFVSTSFEYGYLGVPIFFVISGFVISYGVGSATITSKYLGNFILRRSIRLDITYWASIFLALALIVIKNSVLSTQEQLPSITDVIFHMFYLQDILSIDPVISVVYWTLCMEVQLYIFFIISLWFSQKVCPPSRGKNFMGHNVLIVLIGIYSICLDLNVTSIPVSGLFISNWHFFLMGVLVSNVVQKIPYSSCVFFIWLVIEVLFQIGVHVESFSVAGIFCSFLIYSLWKMNRLNNFLTGKVFSYFGAISYTLYLVHPDIGWKVISFGKLLLSENSSPVLWGLLFLIGVAISILVAHLFHVAFERPSLWVCKKLKTSSLSSVFSEFVTLRKASKLALRSGRQ